MATYVTDTKLTIKNIDKFTNDIFTFVDNGEELVLDMHQTKYISSIVLRTLLSAAKVLKAKHLPNVKVINVTPEVRDIFEMTGFVGILDIK